MNILLVGALAFTPLCASAQSVEDVLIRQVGTISVNAPPQFNSGKLVGCSLEFNVFARDWTYKNGAFIKINGSTNLMVINQNLFLTLKVVLHDFNLPTMAFVPATPASAYLISANRRVTSADMLVSVIPSDTPGALFSVFKTDAFEMLSDSVANDRLLIGFARTRGSQDILLSIELDVIDTDNNGVRKRAAGRNSKEFFECTQTLVTSLEKQ